MKKNQKQKRKERHEFSQTMSSTFIKLVGHRLLEAMKEAMWQEVEKMEEEIRNVKVPKK